jgi:hypothetical protein
MGRTWFFFSLGTDATPDLQTDSAPLCTLLEIASLETSNDCLVALHLELYEGRLCWTSMGTSHASRPLTTMLQQREQLSYDTVEVRHCHPTRDRHPLHVRFVREQARCFVIRCQMAAP